MDVEPTGVSKRKVWMIIGVVVIILAVLVLFLATGDGPLSGQASAAGEGLIDGIINLAPDNTFVVQGIPGLNSKEVSSWDSCVGNGKEVLLRFSKNDGNNILIKRTNSCVGKSQDNLKEYSCRSNQLVSRTIVCANGCENGACIGGYAAPVVEECVSERVCQDSEFAFCKRAPEKSGRIK